jgi:putative heme-binding domain-containing protein
MQLLKPAAAAQRTANAKREESRLAAIRALASFDRDEAAALLLSVEMRAQLSIVERDAAIGALLTHRGHQARVLAAIEGGTLSASALSAQRRDLLLKDKVPAIRERAEKLFAQAGGDRQKAFDAAKAALALEANAARGRNVFKTLCATCHRLEREGFAVGPDLFDIRNQPKENILFHIVVPDAEVAPAFAAYSCEMRDGRAFVGILASETPAAVAIRMPGGAEETLLRRDVQSLTPLPGSLMPAGFEAAMSQQELADLLAWLRGED